MKSCWLISLSFIVVMILFPYCEKKPIIEKSDPFQDYCDSLARAGIIDNYIFPILPGSEEWSELTFEQKDSVLLVPEELLKNMCTPGLLQTCMDYPFLRNCIDWESIKTWWIIFNQTFNGIVEFTGRPDAPGKLLTQYLDFDHYPYPDTLTAPEKYIARAQLVFMEIALSQDLFLAEFTNDELEQLINKVLANLSTKLQSTEFIDDSWMPVYSGWILGRIMLYKQYQPFLNAAAENETLDRFINGVGWKIYYFVVGGEVHNTIISNITPFLETL